MDYPSVEEFLLVAEAVLGIPAGALSRAADLGLAESALAAPQGSFGGEEFYPDPAMKAAILCIWSCRCHRGPPG
jgi:death on curing protein